MSDEQKPVAYGMARADGLILDVITPEEHESHAGEYTVPLCRCAAPAPVVPDIVNPITNEQIIEAASNWDCGMRHENEEWAFKRPRELLQFARAVLALSAAPVVPLTDEQIDALWRAPMSADWEHREFACAVVAKFCKINGIGGGGNG